MSDQYDEIELIRRIQKGDESALTIIISEYHPYVVKIVYSILGSYAHKVDLQGVVNQSPQIRSFEKHYIKRIFRRARKKYRYK